MPETNQQSAIINSQSAMITPQPETLLIPLTNRSATDAPGRFLLPADGWYHLIPRGEFPHREAKAVQVLDDRALAEIVNRFNGERAAAEHFAGTLIDFDHFSYDTGKSSEAAGWIVALENRADGVWAQIRWSDAGESAVASGRYRFVSPVWLPSDTEPVDSRPGITPIRHIRPIRLDSAGLTNQPNLRGMVPLSNRQGDEGPAQFRRDASAPAADSKTTTIKEPPMKSIAAKLGLSAEASEDAILAAVTQIQNRAADADKALEPLNNRVKELETQNQGLLEAQVQSDLARYENRFKPEDKPKIEAALRKDPVGARTLLDLMPIANAGHNGNGNGHGAVLNRADAKTPAAGATTAEPTVAEQMKAAMAEEMKDGKSEGKAIALIANRNPKLYQAWREAGAPNWK
jgi:phage I-like protein